MHPAGAPLGCGAGGLIVLLAPPPAPWGSHPQLRGFFFKYFIRSGNKLGPEPRDWLLAKLQLQAQLAELGLVGFFFIYLFYCNLFTYFPFQG